MYKYSGGEEYFTRQLDFSNNGDQYDIRKWESYTYYFWEH